jgi:membrane associated rhomboid family serine protease
MKIEKIIIFGAVLAVIYISAFLIPGSVEMFSLDPAKISEFWRFLTYSFVHLNYIHLTENIIGLSLVVFIAYELKTQFSDFSLTYLSSGFLSVMPLWLISPFTVLGASNAVFGAFGLMSQEIKKFNIKRWKVFLVLTGVAFIGPVAAYLSGGFNGAFMFSLKRSIAHYSGLLFGAGFFFVLLRLNPLLTKRKRYILRGDDI